MHNDALNFIFSDMHGSRPQRLPFAEDLQPSNHLSNIGVASVDKAPT